MIPVIVICAVTVALMIAAVLFFPRVRLGKVTLDTYWIVTAAGAAILLVSGLISPIEVGKSLIAPTAANPLKILALFLAMTVLSVFLDELGFFRYLASAALKRAHRSQFRLFFILYALVSVLTVFTSNDVIVLSFTPFLCYFAKNAKVDPVPYLAAEFVAANTWSMALIIGNPTNIFLATAGGIDFVEYLRYSLLPTLFAGTAALGALLLLFRKKLAVPLAGEGEDVRLEDLPEVIIGLVILGACTLLLAVGPYFGWEMWIVAVSAAGLLFLAALLVALIRKRKPAALLGCLKRAPYPLIPFILSMFVLISGLTQSGVTDALAHLFGKGHPVLTYGTASFLAANLVNNIPMSVLFSSVISSAEAGLPALFATVIGSNLGAFFTPIGALAGMMWSSMLHRQGIPFGYADFLKIGVTVALPALFAALGGLMLALLL